MLKKHYHRSIGRDVVWLTTGACVLVASLTAWMLMAGRGHSFTTTSPTVAFVTYALALGAGAAAYVLWRLAGVDGEDSWNRRLSGWLALGLVLGALPAFLLSFLQESQQPGAPQGVEGWLLVNQLAVAGVLVIIARECERFDVLGDPALVGAVGGMVLTAATCLGVLLAPGFRFGPGGTAVAGTLLVLIGLVLAWNLLQREHVSLWVRQRLAFSAVALVSAQAAGHLDGSAVAGTAIGANLLGGFVLCATAVRLLWGATRDHQDQVVRLRSALVETEVAVHEQRDLLHELGSALAGIAGASEIIQQDPTLPEPRRRRLELMVEAEVARLVRLMDHRPSPSDDIGIDVDEVLGTLVLSHRTRGADVRWRPSGLRASGRADDLAEVVNILLDNAGRHAAGGPVTLSVSLSGGVVEIACSDHGPGVPAELRSRIFERGSRGHHSPGQGLGLAIARRLMTEQGGTLDLRQAVDGATFVVGLPERVSDNEIAREVAHAS
ncbi:sensor histidine kinase [Nocardioides dilutus]